MKQLTYKQFELIPQGNGVRFDLCKHRVKEKQDKQGVKTGETEDVLDCLGYDLSFHGCIQRIVKMEILDNSDVSDLEGYLKEYERINKEHGLKNDLVI